MGTLVGPKEGSSVGPAVGASVFAGDGALVGPTVGGFVSSNGSDSFAAETTVGDGVGAHFPEQVMRQASAMSARDSHMTFR